jgi:hypothetical protein
MARANLRAKMETALTSDFPQIGQSDVILDMCGNVVEDTAQTDMVNRMCIGRDERR